MTAILSYRPLNSDYSHFIKESDVTPEIYKSILDRITAYELETRPLLTTVENSLFQRLSLEKTDAIEAFKEKNYNLLLFILTLGIAAIIYAIRLYLHESESEELKALHEQFTRAFSQMRERQLQKFTHSLPAALQHIQALSYDVLALIPRVRQAWDTVSRSLTLTRAQQIALGKSIELREALKSTHYVINHGQNGHLYLIHLVMQLFKEKFEEMQYPAYIPLRHQAITESIPASQTPEYYMNQVRNDGNWMRELICGDSNFTSTTPEESALDFFARSPNIASSTSFALDIIQDTIAYYIPSSSIQDRLLDALEPLLEELSENSQGTLYSICIPKEKIKECIYFSHPFGIAHLHQDRALSLLDQTPDKPWASQVRILSHKIRAETGTHIIAHSTLSNDALEALRSHASLAIDCALHDLPIPQLRLRP